jgi:lipoprotein-releasing system ATP-binding protein
MSSVQNAGDAGHAGGAGSAGEAGAAARTAIRDPQSTIRNPESLPAILQCRDIDKIFTLGPERLEVLAGVSLEIRSGEIVAILGPSGSGKSTLLHILAGLDKPTAGDVTIAGSSLAMLKDDDLARFRNRNIGLIFQFHHLLPEFTVLENVMMPCLIAGDTTAQAREKAEAALEDICFTIRMQHRPAELSGGEKQKVATARALVTRPLIVMADEPTGNLDFHSSQTLLNLFRDLSVEKKVTMLIVTHNARVAEICNRRLYLTEGRLHDENKT